MFVHSNDYNSYYGLQVSLLVFANNQRLDKHLSKDGQPGSQTHPLHTSPGPGPRRGHCPCQTTSHHPSVRHLCVCVCVCMGGEGGVQGLGGIFWHRQHMVTWLPCRIGLLVVTPLALSCVCLAYNGLYISAFLWGFVVYEGVMSWSCLHKCFKPVVSRSVANERYQHLQCYKRMKKILLKRLHSRTKQAKVKQANK